MSDAAYPAGLGMGILVGITCTQAGAGWQVLANVVGIVALAVAIVYRLRRIRAQR